MPPLACASPCSAPTPISCVPHGVAVRVSLPPSAPPRSSLTPPSAIPPNTLCSSRSTPRSQRRSPPGRTPLRGALPHRRHCSPVLVCVPVSRAPSSPLLFSLQPSSSSPFTPLCAATLFRSHSFLLLRRFSTLPLQALAAAANITRRDEDAGNLTGGVVACWSVAGGSAPCRKCPSRPLFVVRDGISRPQFLHCPQQ